MPVKIEEAQELIDLDLWEIKLIDEHTVLTRVPGGWIQTTSIDDYSGPGRSISETFIPLPKIETGLF